MRSVRRSSRGLSRLMGICDVDEGSPANVIEWKLANTPPTTLAGVAAVLRFANEIEDSNNEWPNTDTIGREGWHYQLRAAMAAAIEALIKGAGKAVQAEARRVAKSPGQVAKCRECTYPAGCQRQGFCSAEAKELPARRDQSKGASNDD
jgi:hypothetical protein